LEKVYNPQARGGTSRVFLGGTPAPFHRIAELHFPSMEVLQAAAGSESAQDVVAHAISISNGGTPVFLIAEEDARTF
jgi:hypothetical protein